MISECKIWKSWWAWEFIEVSCEYDKLIINEIN